jgi:hypothetical protein
MMATFADLKAEIADDLERPELATTIAAETTRAITYYQKTRLYFNETRDVTFSTVANQKLYTTADSASIPKFEEFDQVNVEDGTTIVELDEIYPDEWELLTASGASTGRPLNWTYFNQSIGLYPIPDQAYTIRLIGHIIVDAPTSDADSTNVWITEAFELIRARTCAQICMKKTRDTDGVQLYRAAEMEELNRLKKLTASRVGTGFVTPSEF